MTAGWTGMLRRIREIKHLPRILSIVSGTLVTIALGLACLHYRFGEPIIRWSYDVPFLWRSTLDTREIAIVYLDEYSAKQLNQPLDNVWNRGLHAPLLDRLTEDGARLVFYDIVFDGPAEDPAADAAFADSIKRNGRVVLGAALDIVERMGAGSQVSQERIAAPIPPLRRAAAGWGLLAFRPVDPDYGVRQIYTGTSRVPTSTWKSAELLGAPVTKEPRESGPTRWLNYYGPRDTFASVNIAQALDPQGVPAGFFKDRIVMIGGRPVVGSLQVGRDEFATPYSSSQFTPGVEVHATILLNLLRGEWLTRWQPRWEMIAVILVGLFAGALALLRPGLPVILAATVASLAIAGGTLWSVWYQRVWWPWLIPAAIQIPVGLVWSVGSQYLLESRRRKELRKAFGFYLSPEMADRIADSDFDLRPGGKIVEVSVIFTDLENFTTLSEKLDPKEVSEILTTYFGETTKWILDNRGTIIKYIGDAVFAAWGAPIDEPEHAIRAAEAACDLRRLAELEIHGKKLRTRIGIHSGKVLAGNLGSEYRFDYTMIGDAVNFASRLESLNKYLSTQVLISDAVHQQLKDRFTTRRLGEFRVAGKTESVKIHELLCRREMQNGEPKWIEVFEEGLRVFREGDFEQARSLMERTREVRGAPDGPSEFYLRKIAKLEGNGALENWNGIVELTEK
jgi:adenylate cyclase